MVKTHKKKQHSSNDKEIWKSDSFLIKTFFEFRDY